MIYNSNKFSQAELYKIQLDAISKDNNIKRLALGEDMSDKNKDKRTDTYKLYHHNVHITNMDKNNCGKLYYQTLHALTDIGPANYFSPTSHKPEEDHRLADIDLTHRTLKDHNDENGAYDQIAAALAHHIHKHGTVIGQINDDKIAETGTDHEGNSHEDISTRLGDKNIEGGENPVRGYIKSLLAKHLKDYAKYKEQFGEDYGLGFDRILNHLYDDEIPEYGESTVNFADRLHREAERIYEESNNSKHMNFPDWVSEDLRTHRQIMPNRFMPGGKHIPKWLEEHYLTGLHHIRDFK